MLRDFFHEGQIAANASGNGRGFSDQTVYMGFALLTFAGEAHILHSSGHDPRSSEEVVHRLLRGFETLETEAVKARYHVPPNGFFLRDNIQTWPGHTPVTSDFTNPDPSWADMSIDQAVSLMMGWWAVSHWSTDATNRELARGQADRLLNFLEAERFMIDRPGTHTSVGRGGNDARGAAGFLCHMGEQITGKSYYHNDKVRLLHDNKCHTCGGTGEINIPDPDVQCPACHGKGDCKIVIGGGRCEVCRGTGHMKLVVEQGCPACRGSGEIKAVVTDPWGHDHTVGSTRCGLCGGSGKIGSKTELGKCKVCHGSGKIGEYIKDLGRCKLCGGSGRLKATLPKMKCPVCGGSKELNLYVAVIHPLVLALEPVVPAVLDAPRLELHGITVVKHNGVPDVEIHDLKVEIHSDNRASEKSYVRHMNQVLMAFEKAVPNAAFLALAEDSRHPWSVALRAAIDATVCPSCSGLGKIFMTAPETIVGMGALHLPQPPAIRHELGICQVCRGTGRALAAAEGELLIRPVMGQLLKLHRDCPADGPSDHSPTIDWCKDNRWIRCTDLTRGTTNFSYNGLDFLSMEVLIRLAGEGGRL